MACAIGALALGGLAPPSEGAFLFEQVSNNGQTPVAQQFSLDIVDQSGLGVGVVGLKVSNSGPIASSIATFHVDDTPGLFSGYFGPFTEGSTAFGNGAGVSMGPPPPANSNFPDAPNPWTTDYYATANSAPPVNGVNPGETFELRLVLAGGMSLQDAIDAFASGDARVGIHVIDIDDEGSESFATPTPGAVTLGAFALGIAGTRRRR